VPSLILLGTSSHKEAFDPITLFQADRFQISPQYHKLKMRSSLPIDKKIHEAMRASKEA